MFAAGLSQKFLGKRLEIDPGEPGVGGIIEKKEEKGLGITIDVILYNGTLRVNDNVAFAAQGGVKTAKIRALLRPRPLQELRESSGKFIYVEEVSAAAGIKLSGSGMEEALPGSMIISTDKEGYENDIESELKEVFTSDKTGIVLKADTIGSVEALSKLLGASGVKISKKGLGNVTKRDVLDAFSMRATDPSNAVIIAFNVGMEEDAELESHAAGIDVLRADIIYKLMDDLKEWMERQRQGERKMLEQTLTFPGMVLVLPNAAFRMSHPAVFGVDVLAGRIKPSYRLMKENGEVVGSIKEIQDNGIGKQEARKGESVAISMDGITFGRQIRAEDRLYTYISSDEIRELKFRHADMLGGEDIELLDKLADINRLARERG
jgi:translation initiation factor 5B